MRFENVIGRLPLLALLVLSSALVHGQAIKGDAPGTGGWNFPDFSGTQVFVSAGREMTAKIYRSGTMVRIDHSASLATLYVPARSRVYRLTKYPNGSRQCVVMRNEQAKMLPSPIEVLLSGSREKRTPVGSDVVEGHSCRAETVVLTRFDGKTVETNVCVADDLKGLPIRIEMDSSFGKLRAIYRDIVFGAPDPTLFALPDKCTPVEKMGQVVEQETLK
jgi:hypothetical protein